MAVKGTKAETSPGVWRLRVYAGRRESGSPIQVTKTVRGPHRKPGSGARLADRELAGMVAAVSKGNTATGTETFGELLTLWLDHIEADRSPTTMRKYRDMADRVVDPELGRIKLRALTVRHLDTLYGKLTAQGKKATTVRRVHALIGAALHQGEKWDMVDRSVARKASPPQLPAAVIEAPSPGQVQAILAAAEGVEPTLAVLLLMAALTGARRGELCALRWTDLDWQASTLTIARSVYETAGGGWAERSTKSHQARTIGLDDLGIEALRRHRASADHRAGQLGLEVLPDGFMFSRSPAGSEPFRPDLVTKFTKRVAAKAKVDTHLQALRHFSASQAIAAGFDPATVGARLGHADLSVTLRVYSPVLEQRDRDLAASLGQALTP